MKPQYAEIWQNLHIVKHIPDDPDDPVSLGHGGEIIYQYKDLPCYVAVFYFDDEDYFENGNTTYFLDSLDEDPLDTLEYYDLDKEDIAQVIIDLYTGEHNVSAGVKKFGMSQDELRNTFNQLDADPDSEDDPVAKA